MFQSSSYSYSKFIRSLCSHIQLFGHSNTYIICFHAFFQDSFHDYNRYLLFKNLIDCWKVRLCLNNASVTPSIRDKEHSWLSCSYFHNFVTVVQYWVDVEVPIMILEFFDKFIHGYPRLLHMIFSLTLWDMYIPTSYVFCNCPCDAHLSCTCSFFRCVLNSWFGSIFWTCPRTHSRCPRTCPKEACARQFKNGHRTPQRTHWG